MSSIYGYGSSRAPSAPVLEARIRALTNRINTGITPSLVRQADALRSDFNRIRNPSETLMISMAQLNSVLTAHEDKMVRMAKNNSLITNREDDDFRRAVAMSLAPAPSSFSLRTPAPIMKVELQKARQYDMPGSQPAACTFHAVQAMSAVASNFSNVAQAIIRGDNVGLSQFQRNIIQDGLVNYDKAVKKQPDLLGGADLEHVRRFIPGGIRMDRSQNGVYMLGVKENPALNAIADYLFSAGSDTKVVWVKNGNDESFALVARGNQVILFDSHVNEICMLSSKAQAMNAIQAKLGNEELNLFDYALGTV